MNNQNYNGDFNQNERQTISKRLLSLIFLGAVVLAFFLGFMFNVITKVDYQPSIPNENNSKLTFEQKAYADLYEFLDKNYYKEVDKNEAFYYQLTSLVDSLGDPYTQISLVAVTPGVSNSNLTDYDEEHFEGLGISFIYEDYMIKINEVMRHSPAEKAYIYPGDNIIGVRHNGRDIIFRDEKTPQTEALLYVRGNSGDERTLIIERLDQSRRVIVVRYERFARPTVTSNIDDVTATYGYIKIHQFEEKTSLVFAEHLAILEQRLTEDQTLIIDLRDNPGGYLTTIVPIMQQFITSDHTKVIGIKASKTGKTFYYGGALAEKKPYNIKVLVDENTASASEMLAASLHYFGGYEVFGKPTYGKNVYQTTVNIPMTEQIILSLKYTEGYWFYGENNIMDKDTNPIPVTEVLPKGILTIEVPYYTKDVSLDEVNIGLESAQKYLNVYNPLLNLREDGYMDIATLNAIKQFQQDMGLYPSGIYNLQTSQKMYDDYMSKLENHLFDNQIQFLLTWKS